MTMFMINIKQGHGDDWEHITINFVKDGDGEYVQDSVTWLLSKHHRPPSFSLVSFKPKCPHSGSNTAVGTHGKMWRLALMFSLERWNHLTTYLLFIASNFKVTFSRLPTAATTIGDTMIILYSHSYPWCDGHGFVWDYDYCAGGCGYWDDFR